jgi:hypothetical protein
MKGIALLVLAIAAGCSGPGDSSTPDGPILRPDSENDVDFDGVPNDMDNCPASSNAFQGNEDGDKFGDACDACPIVADDNPTDGDGDGVADPCDPKPIIIGDRIAFFEGFHQAVPQGWDQAGTWSTSGDQLLGSATGAGHFSLLVTERTRETVSASITVVSVAGASSEVGLVDTKQVSADSAIACVLTPTPEISVYDTNTPGGAMTAGYEMTAGETYVLKLQRENSTYTCTADRGGTTASASKQFTLQHSPYQSGLTINAASVRVNWILVVESL